MKFTIKSIYAGQKLSVSIFVRRKIDGKDILVIKNFIFKYSNNRNERENFYQSQRFISLFDNSEEIKKFKKKIETAIFESTHIPMRSLEKLTDDEYKFIINKLNEVSKGYDFADNFRCGKIGKSSSMRAYNREKESGCCGFFDDFVEYNGNKYLIGFNYGH